MHALRIALSLSLVTAAFLGDDVWAAPPEGIFSEYDASDRPGVAVGVLNDGELVYSAAFGSPNLDYETPLTTESVFYLASVSKQFTAGCIALLTVEGKLDLDETVRRYVPELPLYAESITVRHLVYHTSGMRDWLILHYLRGGQLEDHITPEYALDLIVRQEEPTSSAGTTFSYCNSGYTLMAEIVSRVSGQHLDDFAREHFFEPLGMDATHFGHDTTRTVPNRVTGYSPAGEGEWTRHVKNITAIGSGNVLSSIDDVAKWAANLRTGEVGGSAWRDLMMTPGALDDGTPISYGFGLFHNSHRGQQVVQHGGIYAGFRTELLQFRNSPWTFLVLSNDGTADVSEMAYELADHFMGDSLDPEAAATRERHSRPERLPDGMAEALAGTYIDQATRDLWRVIESRGALRLDGPGPQPVSLAPIEGLRFGVGEGSDFTITFDKPSGDRVTQFYSDSGDGVHTFARVDVPEATPDYLAGFVGRYYSNELDCIFAVHMEDAGLVMTIPLKDMIPLRILAPDRFGNQLAFDAQFLFERDANGNVMGIDFRAANVRDIDFERVD